MYHVLLFPPPAMVRVRCVVVVVAAGWGPLGARGGKGTSGKSGTNRDIHNNILPLLSAALFSFQE